MKRRILFLALVMTLILGSAALADNSVLRQDGVFAMQFDSFSGVEAHAMRLKKGDTLAITGVCQSGDLEIVIKKDSGEVVFTSTGSPTPATFLEIYTDGVYRITATGQNARGSIQISVGIGMYQTPSEAPQRIERIQGSLGYVIEYNPDVFTYDIKDAGDFFIAREDFGNPQENYRTYLWIGRYEGTLDDTVEKLLQEPGAQEQPATIIDYRAARIVRFQTGSAPDASVVTYTIVEAGQNFLFTVTSTYPLGREAEIKPLVEAMLASLQFQY